MKIESAIALTLIMFDVLGGAAVIFFHPTPSVYIYQDATYNSQNCALKHTTCWFSSPAIKGDLLILIMAINKSTSLTVASSTDSTWYVANTYKNITMWYSKIEQTGNIRVSISHGQILGLYEVRGAAIQPFGEAK